MTDVIAINIADDEGLAETPDFVTDKTDIQVISDMKAKGYRMAGSRNIVKPARGVRIYFIKD